MKVDWKFTWMWTAIVLIFGVAVEVASAQLEFLISYAMIGSVAIYCAMGYWGYHRIGYISTVGAALTVQLIDATLGWFISIQFLSGLGVDFEITPPVYLLTLLMTLFFAFVCATAGSTLARISKGQRVKPQK